MGTFRARGAGGVELELDDLDLSTPRGELLAAQIRKGDLVVLTDDGQLGGEAQIDEFLGVSVASEDLSDPDAVPDGNVAAVIDWVRGATAGADPADGWEDRAQRALDAEHAGKDRSSLVEKLEEILSDPDA